VAAARRRLPARLHAALSTVGELVLGRGAGAAAGDAADAADEFVVRFQQACGAVMAKGVEDTAYYRWVRLAALNEVGGDPGRFGSSVAEFHEFAGRIAAGWPATMTALSTHDTKRQEDVRARLCVLAELPQEWEQVVAAWHERAGQLAAGPLPEAAAEYLCWQTLVGAWPVSGDRLASYLRKAMREAKTRTSWTEPDHDYEQAVLEWASRAVADPWLSAAVAGFADRIRPAARVNSLGAKLVQLTMPGVADVYQGCELGGFSLVDPDNRRPVDFARRRRMLADLAGAGEAGPGGTADAEKLLVTAAALRLRRDHPDWFGGSYQPAAADGPAAGHVLAFTRGHAVTVATRLPAGLARCGGWADTALPLPGGCWRDVLTGTLHRGARPPLAGLTRRLPVALLVPADDRPGTAAGGAVA
jgi:(1->4)-alpha-D-glucan 1-alpha-D-glucosylmutase